MLGEISKIQIQIFSRQTILFVKTLPSFGNHSSILDEQIHQFVFVINCSSFASLAPTIPARTVASGEDVRERMFANDHLAADERGSSFEESMAIGTHLEVHRELDLFVVAEPCIPGLLFLSRQQIGEH